MSIDDQAPFDVDSAVEFFADGPEQEDLEEVKDSEVLKEVLEPHLMFDVQDLKKILQILNSAKSPGTNIYDKSLWISPKGQGTYQVYFTSFGVKFSCRLVSTSPSPENLYDRDVLVEIDSLSSVIRYSGDNLLLYVKQRGLFAVLFGGEVFVPSYYNTVLIPYDPLLALLDGTEQRRKVGAADTTVVRGAVALSAISRSSQSVTQKILFFDRDGVFVNAGGSSVKFSANVGEFALQPKGVSCLAALARFEEIDELGIYDIDGHIELSWGHTRLFVEKTGEQLPDVVKQAFSGMNEASCTVSYNTLVGISQVLSTSSFEGGVIDMEVSGTGVYIRSKARDGSELSHFKVGLPGDDGRSVTITVSTLRLFLPLFKGVGNLTVGVRRSTVVLAAGSVIALIAGR